VVPSKGKAEVVDFFLFSKLKMDPLWLANSKLRRGKLDEAINICNEILANNPGDQVRNNRVFTLVGFDYYFCSLIGSLAD
jgi:hypothetical protein